ncbi:MAG: serine/threonine-protein kinase [Planctomycetota bacterium]
MSEASDRQSEQVAADLSGRQLGDYRLLRRLGRGAMAEVYLAEQSSLGRQVAVKVLKRELATDQTYIRRFQREARAAAALVHANIVQIHEVGCIEHVHFIAQEYVPGLNLRQWVARNGTLDLRMALVIMRQVAAALSKAAEQGIVHRDIKPENIMLTRSGEVKVADFGLARLPGAGDSVDLTQAGMTLGTPLYMSPEQVEGAPLDPRSDIYSFGVACYQMLAGAPPFSGETALSVAVQHLKKLPESLENRCPDLPPALCRMVHKMLAKAPEGRYQSARELLRELRQLQLEHFDEEWPEDLPGWEITEPTSAEVSLRETTQQLDILMKAAGRRQTGRFRWLLWAAGLLGAFLLGSGSAWLTVRQPPLLAQTTAGPQTIPRFETVFTQWTYAVQMGTEEEAEEAWKAFIEYFRDEPDWVNRAKKQLAWIYLTRDDYDHALKIFEGFAGLDGSYQELRAFGLAGQYWVLTRQKKYREAADALDAFLPIRTSLDDPDMRRMLGRELGRRPEASSDPRIRAWLDQLDQEAAEPD